MDNKKKNLKRWSDSVNSKPFLCQPTGCNTNLYVNISDLEYSVKVFLNYVLIHNPVIKVIYV